MTLGDLKSAFMQSDKDVSERPQGQLYASLLAGGIPNAVEEGSLVQLNAAVYGLVNAPSAWRMTIVRGIEGLGYRRSCYDPCIFCLMGESGPHGHILIEVDDLATHRNAVHVENMAKLQKTFKFGKWKCIYNSEGDYAGRTVIQDQSYSFHFRQVCSRETVKKEENLPALPQERFLLGKEFGLMLNQGNIHSPTRSKATAICHWKR